MRAILMLLSVLFLAASCNVSKPDKAANQNVSGTEWKNFKNATYQFEISFPSNFKLKESFPERGIVLYELTISDPSDHVYWNLTIWKKGAQGDVSEVFKYSVPGTIPANEIAGPTTLVNRNLKSFQGIEAYGARMEGHSYSDIFYYKDGSGRVWEVELDPVIEGRIKNPPYEYFSKDVGIYKKLVGSFKPLSQK